jgi:phosphoenolpyruvate synthase/pyruvate phosphate dikinase
MIDPVSAVATATAAYNALQKGIKMGKELESMAATLGTWFDACRQVKDAQDEIENPPLFKSLTNKQSVEQEALLNMQRRKRIAQQEYDLRMTICLRYGEQAYIEMMRDRDTITAKRKRQAERQAHRRKNFVLNTLLFLTLGGALYFFWIVFRLFT